MPSRPAPSSAWPTRRSEPREGRRLFLTRRRLRPTRHVDRAPRLLGVPLHGVLHPERRVTGPHRVVLVSCAGGAAGGPASEYGRLRHGDRGHRPDACGQTALMLTILLRVVQVREPKEFDDAFATMKKERVPALLAIPDPLVNDRRGRIVAFAATERLPQSTRTGRSWTRGSDVLRRGSPRLESACCDLRRPDPQGRQARRPAHRAAIKPG
jgi:hypothetical protein